MLNIHTHPNLPAAVEVLRLHHVSRAYLFGSYASGTAGEDSDIDLLITFSPDISLWDYADNYFDLADALTALFGREVDLVEEQALRNPIFINELNRTKLLIYDTASY